MKICIIYNYTEKLAKGIPSDISSFNSIVPTVMEIKEALESKRHTVSIVQLKDNLTGFINLLKKENPELVFNLCEAHQGNSHYEINIPAVLELLGFPYTGSEPFTLGLTLNKAMTKDLLTIKGINTPKYMIFQNGAVIQHKTDLRFPLIVKPLSEDGSIGIDDDSVVRDKKKLRERVQYLHKYYKQSALVEEFIPGREIYVSIIGNSPPLILPLAELDYSCYTPEINKICSYKAKWDKDSIEYGSKSICPIKISRKLEKEIRAMSLKAYTVTGCRDYARIDFRLDENNIPYILEVNANPDLSIQAGLANVATAQNMAYADLIEKIVRSSEDRKS